MNRESEVVDQQVVQPVKEKVGEYKDRAKDAVKNAPKEVSDYEQRAKDSLKHKIEDIKEKSGEFFDSAYNLREKNALERASHV